MNCSGIALDLPDRDAERREVEPLDVRDVDRPRTAPGPRRRRRRLGVADRGLDDEDLVDRVLRRERGDAAGLACRDCRTPRSRSRGSMNWPQRLLFVVDQGQDVRRVAGDLVLCVVAADGRSRCGTSSRRPRRRPSSRRTRARRATPTHRPDSASSAHFDAPHSPARHVQDRTRRRSTDQHEEQEFILGRRAGGQDENRTAARFLLRTPRPARRAPTAGKKKARLLRRASRAMNPGNVLLSHTVARAVPSALRGLTAVFGMGTGVALSLWSPGKIKLNSRAMSRSLTSRRTRESMNLWSSLTAD